MSKINPHNPKGYVLFKEVLDEDGYPVEVYWTGLGWSDREIDAIPYSGMGAYARATILVLLTMSVISIRETTTYKSN